ncbi:MAG: hypothetical protein MI861_04690 [Pirellulales bacterium]|nr:hypothetical protein [Pirellulales bacterium]
MDLLQAILTAMIGAAGGLASALLVFTTQQKKIRTEAETQRMRLAEEYGVERSVEMALRHSLNLYHLPYRSFQMIRHHIGGFESNELRKHLVRAGAVRFIAADGTELWALRERVLDDFKHSRWKHPDSPMNKPDPDDLFPQAFGDPSQH